MRSGLGGKGRVSTRPAHSCSLGRSVLWILRASKRLSGLPAAPALNRVPPTGSPPARVVDVPHTDEGERLPLPDQSPSGGFRTLNERESCRGSEVDDTERGSGEAERGSVGREGARGDGLAHVEENEPRGRTLPGPRARFPRTIGQSHSL